jgi:flagellar hook-length control protein FliK
MSDNVTSASSSTFAGGEKVEHEAREKEREERDEGRQAAWALALTGAVLYQLPRLSLEHSPGSPANGDGAEAATEGVSRLGDDEPAQTRGAPARSGSSVGDAGAGDAEPERMSVDLEDARLGKVAFTVTREARGLGIVIGVADSHVKALIEAERLSLIEALKAAGLDVARVEVTAGETPGTLLAPTNRGVRSSMSSRGQSARVRAYRTSLEEEPASTAENVDLTA